MPSMSPLNGEFVAPREEGDNGLTVDEMLSLHVGGA